MSAAEKTRRGTPLEKYTHAELVRLARKHVSKTITGKMLELWADALSSPHAATFNWVVNNCPISRPTCNKLHTKILAANPELLLQFPTCWTPLHINGRAPTPEMEAVQAQLAARKDQIASTPESKTEFTDNRAEHKDPLSYKKYLEKDHVEDILAQHIETAHESGRISELIKLTERQAKMGGWDQEVRVEYLIQQILPPGGVNALPAEVARLVAEIKERGILEAEYEPVQKETNDS